MASLEYQLKRPFPVKAIKWRVGATNRDKTKGIALAYIDSRDVMKRLDDVFGISGWQSHIVETPTGRILCTLSVKVDDQWIERTDGAGDTQVEGEKGAISDAIKRAAVQLGIGQYLYKLPNVWCDLDNRRLKAVPQLPEWATPEGYDKIMEARK